MERIHHVSGAATGSDLFATAEVERRVAIWSFTERRKVVEFQTQMDFGETRLLLLPAAPEPLLIAGAESRHGVTAYTARTGETVWHRKDIKGVQQVSGIPGTDRSPWIGVAVAGGPYQILDSATGVTRMLLQGVEEALFGSGMAVLRGPGSDVRSAPFLILRSGRCCRTAPTC